MMCTRVETVSWCVDGEAIVRTTEDGGWEIVHRYGPSTDDLVRLCEALNHMTVAGVLPAPTVEAAQTADLCLIQQGGASRG
jgi:hypothetical protein